MIKITFWCMAEMKQTGKSVVVISLGGSTLYSGERFDSGKARELASVFSLVAQKYSLIVVVGGGALARTRVEKARAEGKSEFEADLAAIAATGVNARKIAVLLDNAVFAKTFARAMKALDSGKTVVSCGMMPGLTTDSISVLYAELARAKRVVNVSSINGIYSEDPRKNPGAKRHASLSHEQLVELAVKGDSRRSRENFIFDLVACKLAARSGIPVYFVSTDSLEIENAVAGRGIKGTVVGK